MSRKSPFTSFGLKVVVTTGLVFTALVALAWFAASWQPAEPTDVAIVTPPVASAPSALEVQLPVHSQILDFSLQTQENKTFTRADLLGKVWVADFIFTSCTGPCPIMSNKLRAMQDAFKADDNVRFVSISVDPENDTPAVLLDYAKKYQADLQRWVFLTGTTKAVNQLAVEAFKLASAEDVSMHSDRFVLVDREAKVRGYYDSQSDEATAKLRVDVQALLGQVKSPVAVK